MDENQISQRRVILGSVTKQHSSGNIVFAVRMPLTGDSLATLPDWLSTGYAAVAQQLLKTRHILRGGNDQDVAYSRQHQRG